MTKQFAVSESPASLVAKINHLELANETLRESASYWESQANYWKEQCALAEDKAREASRPTDKEIQTQIDAANEPVPEWLKNLCEVK
jgi:hypothetical protein